MLKTFDLVGALDNWKGGGLPVNQTVNIVLNNSSRLATGEISITAALATNEEVDYAVDQLITNLETVRKKAKDKLQKK